MWKMVKHPPLNQRLPLPNLSLYLQSCLHLPPTTPPLVSAKMCKHFLKGTCRHGFSGKVERDNIKECKYSHPKLCKKFLDHGTSKYGCSLGKGCEFVHPKLCKESMESKICTSTERGKRCVNGYHIKGTKVNPPLPPHSLLQFFLHLCLPSLLL